CQVAAVAAHDLDDEGALMARRGAVEGVERLDDAVQRRVGPEGHIGPEHVVVDRARYADEPEEPVLVGGAGLDVAGLDEFRQELGPLLAEAVRAGQAAVAADDDQPVDTAVDQVAGCTPAALPRPEGLRAGRTEPR